MGRANVVVENDQSRVACAVSAADWDEVREWLCYIKPLGPDMTVTARGASHGDVLFRAHICGNELAPPDGATASERDECRSAACRPLVEAGHV